MALSSGWNRTNFYFCTWTERFTWSICHESQNHVIVGSSRSKRRTLRSCCHSHLVLDHLSVQAHETVPKSSARYVVCVCVIELCISASGCASRGHSQTRSDNQI